MFSYLMLVVFILIGIYYRARIIPVVLPLLKILKRIICSKKNTVRLSGNHKYFIVTAILDNQTEKEFYVPATSLSSKFKIIATGSTGTVSQIIPTASFLDYYVGGEITPRTLGDETIEISLIKRDTKEVLGKETIYYDTTIATGVQSILFKLLTKNVSVSNYVAYTSREMEAEADLQE
jgi:hypothetical protein